MLIRPSGTTRRWRPRSRRRIDVNLDVEEHHRSSTETQPWSISALKIDCRGDRDSARGRDPALLSRLPMRASYLTSIQRTCSFAR